MLSARHAGALSLRPRVGIAAARSLLFWVALVASFAGCAPAPKGTTESPPPPPASEERPGEPTAKEPEPDVDVQLAFERGSAALGAGRYSEAIPYLYDVLEERPSHTIARYNLGVALQRVRQWQESTEVLTAKETSDVEKRRLAAEVDVPTDADADYVHALGAAFQELRRFDAALACFDAAIAQDKSHLKSRYARALCLQLRGDLQSARTAWRDYLSRDAEGSWADSARKHLAEVETRLSSQSR